MKTTANIVAVMILLAAVRAGAAQRTAVAGDCYAGAQAGTVRSLNENRDRLVADLARRRGTNSCALWASLNKAERYVFLMDTAYLGDRASLLFPPGSGRQDTALDHATALYSVNGPKAGEGVDGSGRGGNDYNRIYLGFDALASCVMRNPAAADPGRDPLFNAWVPSDDGAGPHKPFTARDMIAWDSWLGLKSLNTLGPQFHFWRSDADLDQTAVNARLGVCGVSDPTLTELTVAFDFFHNSDPLGDYAGRGGYGWQIVDQHVALGADWSYSPGACAPTPPLNDASDGGGTFNGMGPVLSGGVCVQAPIVPPALQRKTAANAGPAARRLQSLAQTASW